MTLPRSNPSVRRGTRRLHVGSDRVWRLVQIDQGEILIVRQGDCREQLVHSSDWLGPEWASPRSRKGARR